jgi:sugar/nucleoside kinase (ribokinase family)
MKDDFCAGPIDVYLYGMTVYSAVHVLEGGYPEPDSYGEISRSYAIPGGETGNSAIILSQAGLKVKIDGPYLGTKTKEGIEKYCRRFGIDCSGMVYDPSFEGVQDMVLVDKSTRTVFGSFGSYFREGRRWSDFDRASAAASKIVSIDPFFGDVSKGLAEFCHQNGKPYVTIDCEPGGVLHRHAAAVVISGEYIRNNYKGIDIKDLFKKYSESGSGLVIFTFGSKDILYGRKGEDIKSFSPFRVEVAGTLGAGDTFRGGVVYGLLKGMSADDTVGFAAATAACVCRRFPMALDPPGLDEIMELAGL